MYRDAVYFWDGSTAEPLATRADATIQWSASRPISDRITSTFEVTGGELGFLALDELDKSGTTEIMQSEFGLSHLALLAQLALEDTAAT